MPHNFKMKNAIMFLSEQGLSEKVRHIMAGSNPRMAVAFLGADISKNLFPNRKIPKNLKVICDIEMGGTNPNALVELGAPNNDNVRYLEGKQLHTKIYLSDKGVVIGSINASNISLNGPEKRIEAGVFFEENSDVYRDASNWFDGKFESSKSICEHSLMKAGSRSAKPPRPNEKNETSKFNLLDLLRVDPHAFGEVGFVVTNTPNNEQKVADSISDNRDHFENQQRTEEKLLPYEGWGEDAIKEWPTHFIGAHRGPEGGIEFFKGRRYHYDKENDVLFADEICWHQSDANFGGCVSLVEPDEALKNDLEAINFFDHVDSDFYTAQELSEKICALRT